MRLTILQEPDPRLRRLSQPALLMDKALSITLGAMMDTMYESQGIGLAAPQVDILTRLVVMDVDQEPLKLINPTIVWQSEQLSSYEEGCLSVAGETGRVMRPSSVKVAYWDVQGQAQERQFEGLPATCIQHEIDHLNGVLFIDHLSRLKRSLIQKRRAKSRFRYDAN